MKKKLLSMLLVLCIALAMLPITALTAADAPAGLSDIRPAEWNVLRLTNIERHNEGQFSLVTFAKMQKYAQIRSDELIKKFSHTRPDGRSCFTVFNDNGFSCSSAAENIAMGQQTAEEVVTGWMNSSGHRANILRENLRYMGVGVTVESSIYWAQYFANNKGSDCKNISFDPNGRYFTLVLENGTTAFAPYDENSVNLKGNKMQFNYPGADTWFDKPGAGEIADELIDPSSPKPDDKPDDTPKDGATPISVTEFGKMLHYAGEDIGAPFLVYYDGNSGAVSGMMRPAVMKTANELGLHIYSMNADLIDSRGNTGLWYLTKYMPELVGKTVNVPSIIYFDGKDIRISSLSDPDFPTANAGNFDKLLKKWGITGNYSAFNPVGEYPDYDFKITSLKGISGAGIQVGNGIDDVKPVFTDGISRPYTLTSSNSSVVKINAAGTGFDVLKIGTATVTATVSNKPWYTKTFSVEIKGYDGGKTGLAIDKLPNKMQYKVGEGFDMTGLELSFLDAGSKKLNLTDKNLTFTISSPLKALKQGTKLTEKGTFKVNITYMERWSKNFEITVGDSVKAAALKDGWYNLRIMNNYFNMTAAGGAELRKKENNDAFYVKNKGDNKFTLKTADGKYIAVDKLADGSVLKKSDEEYLWKYYSENGTDIFSFRPAAMVAFVANACGTENTDGTKIIIWKHDGLDAPNHAEFRFIPTGGSTEKKHPFIDVVAGSYYEDAVVWAFGNNVTGGTSANTFEPNATCTRGQVVTFLWRSKGCPEPTSTKNPFADVKTSDYYYKAVMWAAEKGIAGGTGPKTFSPNATCTSAHVVTFLWRANGSPNKTGKGAYYADAVNWGNANGLLSGTGKPFAPNNNSPRGDIVTYLYRNAVK